MRRLLPLKNSLLYFPDPVVIFAKQGVQFFAKGTMEQDGSGGKFVEVVLKPLLKIKEAGKKMPAIELHQQAHEHCYIARSCNFTSLHQPEINNI